MATSSQVSKLMELARDEHIWITYSIQWTHIHGYPVGNPGAEHLNTRCRIKTAFRIRGKHSWLLLPLFQATFNLNWDQRETKKQKRERNKKEEK